MQPRGPVPFGDDLAHRIVLRRHGAQPFDHGPEPLLVEPQPVEHGGRQPLLVPRRHVLGIGGKDRVAARPDAIGGGLEGGLLGLGRGAGKFCRRNAGARADLGHEGGNVAEILHRPGLRC